MIFQLLESLAELQKIIQCFYEFVNLYCLYEELIILATVPILRLLLFNNKLRLLYSRTIYPDVIDNAHRDKDLYYNETKLFNLI